MHLPKAEKNEAVTLILKIASGSSCNMACQYCYEQKKDYQDIPYMESVIVDQILSKSQEMPLFVELHGGEPLTVGKERLVEIFQIIRKYKNVKHVSIETNGLLLSEDMYQFLSEQYPTLKYSLSLDGDFESNRYRVRRSGENTFSSLQNTLDMLCKVNQKVGIMCAIQEASLGREQNIIDSIAEKPCVTTIKFIPCFDYDQSNKMYISPEQYCDFLISAFEYWQTKAYKNVMIEPFVSIIRAIVQKKNSFCVYNNRKCVSVFTIYPNGQICLCDEMDWKYSDLGNINQYEDLSQIYQTPNYKAIIQDLNDIYSSCSYCHYRNNCRGGCLWAREKFQNIDRDKAYCQMQKKIIDHISYSLNMIV